MGPLCALNRSSMYWAIDNSRSTKRAQSESNILSLNNPRSNACNSLDISARLTSALDNFHVLARCGSLSYNLSSPRHIYRRACDLPGSIYHSSRLLRSPLVRFSATNRKSTRRLEGPHHSAPFRRWKLFYYPNTPLPEGNLRSGNLSKLLRAI